MITEKEADLLRMIAERKPMQQRFLGEHKWLDLVISSDVQILNIKLHMPPDVEYRIKPEPQTVIGNVWKNKSNDLLVIANKEDVMSLTDYRLIAKGQKFTFTPD